MFFTTKKNTFTITDLLTHPNAERIQAWVRSQSVGDLCHQFSVAPKRQAISLFALLPTSLQKEIFLLMDVVDQNSFFFGLDRKAQKALMHWIPMDKVVDFYQSLDSVEQEAFLGTIALERQEELLRLAQYPEGSLGAVMTTEFLTIRSDSTMARVHALAQKVIPRERDNISVAYVVLENGRLLGSVDLHVMHACVPTDSVQKWMHFSPTVISIHAQPREAIALMHRQHAKEIAVVDRQYCLIGVLTHDDLIRLEQREVNRQIVLFGGSSAQGNDLDIVRSPLRKILSVRLYWLVILTVFGMATSTIVAEQTRLLEHAIILAAFIAPIVDMGGNVGSQSATLVIRAMSVGDVRNSWQDIVAIIRRECWVAGILGIVIGLLEGVLAYFGKGISGDVLWVVITSMAICTFLGGLIGALLPFAARRIGTDPATLSSPMITSIMDMLGVVIYFSLAWLFLKDTILMG